MKINCASCNKKNRLPVHQQCFQRQESHDGISSTPRVAQPRGLSSNSWSGVTSPPVTMVSTLPAAIVSELRSTVPSYTVSNPNALGSASELVDFFLTQECVLVSSESNRTSFGHNFFF